jgi:Ca2+-transporting ATPase
MSKAATAVYADKPWTHSWRDILEALDVSVSQGLDTSEVKKRRRRFGANRLRSIKSKSVWQILIEQFQSLIVLLLVIAAAVSLAFGEWVEGIAITAVIVINAAIGFVTELRAVRSMEALQQLGSVSAKVRREGQVREIPAEKLVPGDVVLLEGGDVVTADLRLVEASKLQANESALTGESVPVSKQLEALMDNIPLAERANMVFKGTAITRGSGEGVVVATGMETELGRISSLVEEAEEEVTPLEKRLEQLGRRLVWVTLGIGALVAISGIVAGKGVLLMIETSIALAVASIPEGLPIVATVALARGMWRMARRNALINNLSSVETLGATDVILTDKTGTLTENQMTVTHIALPSGDFAVKGEGLEIEGEFVHDDRSVAPSDNAILRQTLEVGVLCNNASLRQGESEIEAVGDPVEIALLVAGIKAGIERKSLANEKPEVREVAFDPQTKMMATFNKEDSAYRVAVKGALEAVIDVSSQVLTPEGMRELSDKDRDNWLEQNDRMAGDGLRVLAFATKIVETADADPYEDLLFLGLVGMMDPPREEVRPSIETCQDAGVRVVMVTGDQPATAKNVARAVGLVDEDETEAVHGGDLRSSEEWTEQDRQRILQAPIFARVTPKQKLELIALHQDYGSIVAMTGDGVNDAPALKKADIGIAMGKRGTQVAREAADMVLKDDAFSTIVTAIEQGRVIFNNIRRFVLYLLSCNVAEILVIGLASLINAPLPVRPLQILFLNLVTDVFPALALGVGEGDPTIMERPPRDPGEPIMTSRHWLSVAGYGLVITFSVLGSFALAFVWLGLGESRAVTISFLTLAFAQLWHVFDMRDPGSSFLRNDVTQNSYVWGALALCVGLLLSAVYIPGLADVLNIVDPSVKGWALVIGMSLIPWAAGQVSVQLDLGTMTGE